jgi:hypothetical protein
MSLNLHLFIKMLVNAISIVLIGYIAVPATIAQLTSPSPETPPPQPGQEQPKQSPETPEQLQQNSYLGFGGVIGIQGGTTSLSQGTFSIVLKQVVSTQSQIFAQVPNIQGEWKMSIIGENLSSTYSLIQKGKILTGTFRAPLGTFPITGTISKDNKINFSAKAGGGMNLKFVGAVDGKTMKGVADIPMKGRRNWTATQ